MTAVSALQHTLKLGSLDSPPILTSPDQSKLRTTTTRDATRRVLRHQIVLGQEMSLVPGLQ